MDIFKFFVFVFIFILTAVALARLCNFRKTSKTESGEINVTTNSLRSKFSGFVSECLKNIRTKGGFPFGFGLLLAGVFAGIRSFISRVFERNRSTQTEERSVSNKGRTDKEEDKSSRFSQRRCSYRRSRDNIVSDINKLGDNNELVD